MVVGSTRFAAHEGGDLRQVAREAGFDGAAVELAQHPAPEPACDLASRALGLTGLAEIGEERGQRHELGAVGQVPRLEDILSVEEPRGGVETFFDAIKPTPSSRRPQAAGYPGACN